MFKRSKYKKIPEVKAKEEETAVKKAPTQLPEDEEEDIPTPTIEVAAVEEQAFEAIDFLKDLVKSIVSPVITLVITFGAASLAFVTGNPLVVFLFPFAVAILNFVGALPSLNGSFNNAKEKIFVVTDAFMNAFDSAMNIYVQAVVKPIHKLRDTINKELEPMRPKLDKFTKLENKLKKIDPNIDIPDATDLEEEMEAAEDKVLAELENIKNSLDVLGLIPVFIRTKRNFDLYIVYPTLALFLIIQLIVAIPKDNDEVDDSANETVFRYLRGAIETVSTFNETIPVIPDDAIPDVNKEKLEGVALGCFYASLASVLVIFVATLKTVVQSLIQCQIDRIKIQLNEKLEEALQPLKDKVTDTTTKIKDKFSELEEKIEKVESKIPFGLF